MDDDSVLSSCLLHLPREDDRNAKRGLKIAKVVPIFLFFLLQINASLTL